METVLTLPFEIQITLVAGYFGYKIATAGRRVELGTEDIVLQILVFGLLSRLAAFIIAPLSSDIVLISCIAFSFSILAAVSWRTKIGKTVDELMSRLGIYHDDKESSALYSVLNTKARWTYVHLHIDDGRVLESIFAKIPKKGRPGKDITINDDGLVIYITGIYDTKGEFNESEICGNDDDFIVTFIPFSSVKQIDVGWKK